MNIYSVKNLKNSDFVKKELGYMKEENIFVTNAHQIQFVKGGISLYIQFKG